MRKLYIILLVAFSFKGVCQYSYPIPELKKESILNIYEDLDGTLLFTYKDSTNGPSISHVAIDSIEHIMITFKLGDAYPPIFNIFRNVKIIDISDFESDKLSINEIMMFYPKLQFFRLYSSSGPLNLRNIDFTLENNNLQFVDIGAWKICNVPDSLAYPLSYGFAINYIYDSNFFMPATSSKHISFYIKSASFIEQILGTIPLKQLEYIDARSKTSVIIPDSVNFKTDFDSLKVLSINLKDITENFNKISQSQSLKRIELMVCPSFENLKLLNNIPSLELVGMRKCSYRKSRKIKKRSDELNFPYIIDYKWFWYFFFKNRFTTPR